MDNKIGEVKPRTKKREFPHVEENALILGDYNSRDLINDLYGWFKKWIKK